MKNWQLEVGLDIIKKYNSGVGVAKLSKKYNIKQANIRNFLKKHNAKNWKARRIYTLANESLFEKIDTDNKAYLLGFLCADGH